MYLVKYVYRGLKRNHKQRYVQYEDAVKAIAKYHSKQTSILRYVALIDCDSGHALQIIMYDGSKPKVISLYDNVVLADYNDNTVYTITSIDESTIRAKITDVNIHTHRSNTIVSLGELHVTARGTKNDCCIKMHHLVRNYC